ncbi:MAG: hypothetical protein WBX11_17210 [Thiobacillaceae bacterium]|jgi:hypothetical protein
MHFQPSFRIHRAYAVGFPDIPFIITTAYTNDLGYPTGEWFLVVPEGEGVLFAQRTKLEHKAFPYGPVSFDEEFLLNEVLDQARLRLGRYIFETKGDGALFWLSKRVHLLPSNQNHLVSLWMRDSYCGCLSEIRARTDCIPLAETLGWIHSLPKLTIDELNAAPLNLVIQAE